MTSSTNKPADEAPVIERDDRDRAARQARVTEKTGSALKPPGPLPAPAAPSRPPGKPAHAAPARPDDALPPLLAKSTADTFRRRLREADARFIDSPADAAAAADKVLAEAIEQATQALQKRREEISRRREAGTNDTEQLRLVQLRYRAALETIVAL